MQLNVQNVPVIEVTEDKRTHILLLYNLINLVKWLHQNTLVNTVYLKRTGQRYVYMPLFFPSLPTLLKTLLFLVGEQNASKIRIVIVIYSCLKNQCETSFSFQIIEIILSYSAIAIIERHVHLRFAYVNSERNQCLI